ncbi:MAG: Bor family protein [Gemmatimonadota bacterium]|nr:MAG: Bor family protein [Gemmatimonadota bacterium]
MSHRTSRRGNAMLALLTLVLASAACHRVIIDNGLEPSPEVYHLEWNMAFANAIFPAQIDASEFCGGRWAKVETKHSFLNGVVGFITFNIITPMDVRVVCAAGTANASADAEQSPAAELEDR